MKVASALTRLAEWIQSRDLADLSPTRFERVKQHIVDTVGARLAGSRTQEGMAASRLGASMHDPVRTSVLVGCAQARCTEIDDIHLASCTTPGSVVVPTVLSLVSNGELHTVRECCAAVFAGYEALIRLGVAIDGPAVLHRGVWPTHFAASFGSAAAASRAYGLTIAQTTGALATSLAFGSGPPVSGAPSSSSRWATLGVAAANGELAARGAREGILGTVSDTVSFRHLADSLGRRCLFDDVGMKPFATARQSLAAIQAAREIVEAEQLAADDVDVVVASLPELQRRIVDRPHKPASRFASIVSLQYQLALALTAPERLLDVERTPVLWSDNLRGVMARIRVRRGRDLDARYPRTWPARVEIKAGRRRLSRVVLHADGDARRPFGWDQVERKFVALASPSAGEVAARRAVTEMRSSGGGAAMPRLWDFG